MVQTSIQLSDNIASQLASVAPSPVQQSEVVTAALQAYFEQMQHTNDLAKINRHAVALNAEAEDVLLFQQLP